MSHELYVILLFILKAMTHLKVFNAYPFFLFLSLDALAMSKAKSFPETSILLGQSLANQGKELSQKSFDTLYIPTH